LVIFQEWTSSTQPAEMDWATASLSTARVALVAASIYHGLALFGGGGKKGIFVMQQSVYSIQPVGLSGQTQLSPRLVKTLLLPQPEDSSSLEVEPVAVHAMQEWISSILKSFQSHQSPRA